MSACSVQSEPVSSERLWGKQQFMKVGPHPLLDLEGDGNYSFTVSIAKCIFHLFIPIVFIVQWITNDRGLLLLMKAGGLQDRPAYM